MNKAMKFFMVAAMAVMMSGTSMASHICAYVNDNVVGPNFTEGYKIGPGAATAHVGPYFTNGSGIGFGFLSGGLGATRLQHSDLYVEDGASSNITHFTINKTDCTLTLDTTLYPSGDSSYAFGDGLAITPDGGTMFVGSTGDYHIYSHAIGANGSLGPAFTETSTGNSPWGMEVSPDGKTLVVSYALSQQVCAYPISGGHLGAANCQSAISYPTGVSIDPDSACVYAAEGNGITSEVVAFQLNAGILGPPTDYNPFGSGANSQGILVNWDNKALYVTDAFSARVDMATIASGCKLTYRAVISDGVPRSNEPGQIAQAKIAHGYVVTGGLSLYGPPQMGIFRAHLDGILTPLGSGQFPLTSGAFVPSTIMVVGSE
jgi:6-phosphogluconolactonase (cycloisomerase 2 family)